LAEMVVAFTMLCYNFLLGCLLKLGLKAGMNFSADNSS